MLAIRSLTCTKAFCMFSISISRIVLVRFRILMSTVSSFFRLPTGSAAQKARCVKWIDCKFTQCINEQLFRWLKGLNVLEQSFARFVPVDHELMGGVLGNQILERPVAETPCWSATRAQRTGRSPRQIPSLGRLRGAREVSGAARRALAQALSGLPDHPLQGSLLQEGLN